MLEFMRLGLWSPLANGGVGVIDPSTVDERVVGIVDEDFGNDGGAQFPGFLLPGIRRDGEGDLELLPVSSDGLGCGKAVGHVALEMDALGSEGIVTSSQGREMVARDGAARFQEHDDTAFVLSIRRVPAA